MKTITKLHLGLIMTASFIIIFIIVSFLLTLSLSQAYKKEQLAQKISATSYQMAVLRSEYFIYRNDRPKEQSISSYESLSRLLDEAEPLFSEPEEKLLFQEIREVSDMSRMLFGELVKNIEQSGSETVIQELINQLSIKSQTRVSNILYLAELSRQDATQREQGFMVAVIFAGIVVILITLWSYLIGMKTFNSLEHANAKDEAILASLGDGVAVADERGKLIYFNKNARDILGSGVNNDVSNTWQKQYGVFDPVTFEPYPAHKMPLFLAVYGQTSTKVKMFIRNAKVPNGRFISVTATPIFLGGKSIGGVSIFRDMTKEDEIDKAKTEFVSLASHQLRTPLTAISWYTEMILSGDIGKVPPEQRKYLEEIYQSNKRMIELVNTLLNVSHIELGTFTGKPVQTDIRRLVDSVLLEQKPKIKEKRITFIQKLNKNVPLFSIDPKFLRMIFQNLLSNAVAYTPLGGEIKLSISLVSSSQQAPNRKSTKNSILIKISDTGYGIPQTQQNKIFTKLFRADNVKEKDTEGTGLGLYIVKSIVESAGGKIWFESRENKGTTFFVELPLNSDKNRKKMA